MNLRLDARDRAGWRIAIMDVAKGRFRLDGTSRQVEIIYNNLFNILYIYLKFCN